MTPYEILKFLDEFRKLHAAPTRAKKPVTTHTTDVTATVHERRALQIQRTLPLLNN